MKHFGNPKNENLLRSPKFYGETEFQVEMGRSQLITEITQFFLFSQKFHDQSFYQNCEKTEPGTTFLEISLNLAYSIDSKNGLTFEN